MKKDIIKYIFITLILSLVLCVLILPMVDNSFYFGIYIVFSILYLVVFVDKKLLFDLKKYLSMRKKVKKVEYYREKLDDYSPLMCAKLMANKILTKDSIIAMILYLREKGYIDSDGNKLKDNSFMKKHEIFFIDNSKFIFYDLYNKVKSPYNGKYSICQYLEKLVNKDLIEENLVSGDYSKGNLTIRLVDMLPFIYIIFSIVVLLQFTEVSSITMGMIKYIFTFVSAIWITVYIIHINLKLPLRTIQTQKGYDYTIKLFSQKRFLNDFSMISSRTLKEEVLWEYYMRAAIFYNLKGVLDKEAQDFYQDIIKRVGYDDNYYENSVNKIISAIVFVICYAPWVLFLFAGDDLSTIVFISAIVLTPIYMLLIKINYKSPSI